MLRAVSCTLYRQCHQCHCHYQKCRRRIHLLYCLRSNHHLILYHLATYKVYLATGAENHFWGDACGGGGGCGGCGGCSGDVSLLHTGFFVIGPFRFAGFINSSGNCCQLNHKGTSSPSVFLVHPEVQGSICVKGQCFYW